MPFHDKTSLLSMNLQVNIYVVERKGKLGGRRLYLVPLDF
jgi:hypothetical protein